MSVFLFDQIVFGPVQSRRLGASLGVNLLPVDRKYCNYNCIYCECGWNVPGAVPALPDRELVRHALHNKLTEMLAAGRLPDAITFAGNGEPTMHPEFAAIVDDTVALRNSLSPSSIVSVLSNATMLHRQDITEALKKTDMPILKLDAANDAVVESLNRPVKKVKLTEMIRQLKSFDGKCVIQTMFVQGTYNGQPINNTLPEELEMWEKAICEIRPSLVQIYSIARSTPLDTLFKIPEKNLREIEKRIIRHGIQTQVTV
ncbi:MAG: radical SAM protein [Bacteroidales bacterium]|jgi:wyosine [tRNA(Phe)-imidazoG37] synthetase (radical SAM superfamily)|nr:radical SAM protein [Bacteroidales bacterium]